MFKNSYLFFKQNIKDKNLTVFGNSVVSRYAIFSIYQNSGSKEELLYFVSLKFILRFLVNCSDLFIFRNKRVILSKTAEQLLY